MWKSKKKYKKRKQMQLAYQRTDKLQYITLLFLDTLLAATEIYMHAYLVTFRHKLVPTPLPTFFMCIVRWRSAFSVTPLIFSLQSRKSHTKLMQRVNCYTVFKCIVSLEVKNSLALRKIRLGSKTNKHGTSSGTMVLKTK